MAYPKVCPDCGADLTAAGAVSQYASEDGVWEANVTEAGGLNFVTFNTEDTREVYRSAYCAHCQADLEEVPDGTAV